MLGNISVDHAPTLGDFLVPGILQAVDSRCLLRIQGRSLCCYVLAE